MIKNVFYVAMLGGINSVKIHPERITQSEKAW